MANTALIQQKLPKELWDVAGTFTIPDTFLETMPDLIILVLNSKSMDAHEEKQSWFNLLPMMNAEQIGKLKDILTREKMKLEEIEKKYENKKEDIKTAYTNKWMAGNYTENMNKLQKQEEIHQQKDQEEADNLLNQI
ncbi:MAG: hypothetical protein WCG98_00040 [bacterium]